jgi:hypothetical protein
LHLSTLHIWSKDAGSLNNASITVNPRNMKPVKPLYPNQTCNLQLSDQIIKAKWTRLTHTRVAWITRTQLTYPIFQPRFTPVPTKKLPPLSITKGDWLPRQRSGACLNQNYSKQKPDPTRLIATSSSKQLYVLCSGWNMTNQAHIDANNKRLKG